MPRLNSDWSHKDTIVPKLPLIICKFPRIQVHFHAPIVVFQEVLSLSLCLYTSCRLFPSVLFIGYCGPFPLTFNSRYRRWLRLTRQDAFTDSVLGGGLSGAVGAMRGGLLQGMWNLRSIYVFNCTFQDQMLMNVVATRN
jgi:hypothetical protein